MGRLKKSLQLANLGRRYVFQTRDPSQAFLQFNASLEGGLLRLRDRVIEPDHVLALNFVAGMEQQVRPGPVVGEKQQAFRHLVQSSDRVDTCRPRLSRQHVQDGAESVTVAYGRDHAGWLVQGPVRM